MAEIFKEAGYKTGIFGKWHLGDEPNFMPNNQGFDESFFINKKVIIKPKRFGPEEKSPKTLLIINS